MDLITTIACILGAFFGITCLVAIIWMGVTGQLCYSNTYLRSTLPGSDHGRTTESKP